MDSKQIQELCNGLEAASEQVVELFYNSQDNPELKEAFATLWERCQDYLTIFENFSRQ